MSDRSETRFWLFRRPYLLAALGAVAAALGAMLFYPSGERGVSRSIVGVAKLSSDATLVATLTTNKLHGSNNEQI